MNLNDAYKILEISPNSNDNDIKKAYKKLAIKWHPDKNIENKESAEKKFKEISQAFEILSNRQKFNNNNFNYSSSINPNDLFEQMFREMNIKSTNTNTTTRVNNVFNFSSVTNNFSNFNNFNNFSSISSSSVIRDGKKIETVRETTNGITKEKTIITDLKNNTKQIINK
tara:strand:- start:489 stop:995 length:507 start_codon:yes stop_codon:yes gene_type:complete